MSCNVYVFIYIVAAPTASSDCGGKSETSDHDRTQRHHWGKMQ